MIESLRLRWPGFTASAVNPLISDYPAVDLDRKLVPRGLTDGAPGYNLTPDETLQNSAWFRAVNLIGSLVARTPFEIKEVENLNNGTKKTAARDHAGYFATKHQANPDETASECRFRMVTNAVMHGAGYAVIRPNSPDGLRLYPQESRGTRKARIDGKLWYLFDKSPDEPPEVQVDPDRYNGWPAELVIEISGLRKRGLLAYATWYLAKTAISEGSEGSKMRSGRAKNGGRPSVVLSTDAALQEPIAKRLQEDFGRVHAGYEGIGKPALLSHGLKASTLPYAPEFQAEEALVKLPVREIANFTGVPSVFLGDPDGISYESLEKMIEVLVRFGVEPWLHAFEDQVRAKLLTMEERKAESHTAEFDRSAMVYLDGKTMALLIRAWGGGVPIMTPNGILAKLGDPPLDDPEADKLHIPLNVGKDGSNNTPTDGATNDPGRTSAISAPTPAPTVEQGFRFPDYVNRHRVMANIWEDTTRRILKAAERAASNDRAFMQFCDTLDSDPEIVKLSSERSCGTGAALGLAVTEKHALAGLTACKLKLLDVAGSATKGQLHDVFHKSYGSLMVTLPDYAAKAVLEAVSAA